MIFSRKLQYNLNFIFRDYKLMKYLYSNILFNSSLISFKIALNWRHRHVTHSDKICISRLIFFFDKKVWSLKILFFKTRFISLLKALIISYWYDLFMSRYRHVFCDNTKFIFRTSLTMSVDRILFTMISHNQNEEYLIRLKADW